VKIGGQGQWCVERSKHHGLRRSSHCHVCVRLAWSFVVNAVQFRPLGTSIGYGSHSVPGTESKA
jgi:hypothetical protein